MRIRQNGPLDKFMFMHSSIYTLIVTYGMIKIYVAQIYATSAWLA